jgi:hypothetical protein
VIRTVRFKVSPRVVLVALAAASALAVDAWKDWDAARRAPPARSAVSAERLADVAVGLDPAMLAVARRHDPALRSPDLWGRPLGWNNLDMRGAPDLGLARADAQTAREVNALRPFARLPIRPMRPFELALSTPDGARALQCLTQAVYYESAREPLQGQEAVAQVVLNRLRHPAYPKSVCGVVFQGSGRTTGCQFTFTCDGSLGHRPRGRAWDRAQRVATAVMLGYTRPVTNNATHYHTTGVNPVWNSGLVPTTQIGVHKFYRFPRGAERAVYQEALARRIGNRARRGGGDTLIPQADDAAAAVALEAATADEASTPADAPISTAPAAPAEASTEARADLGDIAT